MIARFRDPLHFVRALRARDAGDLREAIDHLNQISPRSHIDNARKAMLAYLVTVHSDPAQARATIDETKFSEDRADYAVSLLYMRYLSCLLDNDGRNLLVLKRQIRSMSPSKTVLRAMTFLGDGET